MDFINNTPFPALNFEGIDQLNQNFHVFVMRQTFTWNEKGLMVLTSEQDPLCIEDVMVDKDDLMSGVLQESDLCHFKPHCDVIVIGHAYTPENRVSDNSFTASIEVQTPDKVLYGDPIPASKYLFAQTQPKANPVQQVKGTVLINKTLSILSPRYATAQSEGLVGGTRYLIKTQPLPHKVTLNPSSSFGGYVYIEENDNRSELVDKAEQIPEDVREGIHLNPTHGRLAYFSQDDYNPYGRGYLTPEYHKATLPSQIVLPQIHYPEYWVESTHLTEMSKGELNEKVHNQLTAGFGIRAKSHPDRHRYLGKIDDDYIENKRLVPEGFDFAMWNCAYPDQQTEKLVGNEWITLTNLCHPNTPAVTLDKQGNTKLRLYLPEFLAYLVTNSNNPDYPESEVPMKLDTVIIQPDEKKVNMVWRGIIAGGYDPNMVLLETADRQKQAEILAQHFTRTGDIIRPYETK